MPNVHPISRPTESMDFAIKYCRRCQAGWTRYLSDGSEVRAITYCLLDREQVPPNITKCDRYATRED